MSVEKYSELRDASGLLRIVPKREPVFKLVDLDKVVINITRNHRDEAEAYLNTDPDMMDLMDSIKVQGIIPGLYPVVHEEPDGLFDTLIGHRRLTACKHLGMKNVMCEVQSGLTEEEKLMVIFNPTEVPPGTIGEYKQVKALLAIGFSRQAIAQKLKWKTGRNRKDNTNLVQYYAELQSLPQEVQEEWRLQQRKSPGKDLTMPNLTQPVVRDLYKAMGKDIALFKQTNGVEGSIKSDGPELTAEIAKLKADGKTNRAEKESRKVTVSILEGFANSVTNHVFKQWIFGIAGTKGIAFGPMLGKINDACNLVMPNPKPESAPKDVEEIFAPEPEVPSEPEVSKELVTVSEGVVTKKNGNKKSK